MTIHSRALHTRTKVIPSDIVICSCGAIGHVVTRRFGPFVWNAVHWPNVETETNIFDELWKIVREHLRFE